MQSTNTGKRYMSLKQIASTSGRREGVRATPKAAMEGWAGPSILILLLLASLVYVVFGGTFALEASPVPEPKTSIAGPAAKSADVGGAPRNEKASGSSAGPTDYFPAGYVNRGRDGDGNVMTYEHD